MMDPKIAEQSVIGCILVDKNAILMAVDKLKSDDFALSDCRTVYEAAKKLLLNNKPIDAVTILHEVGGDANWKVHLVKLAKTAPSIQHVSQYIDIVKDNANRRRALQGFIDLQADLIGDVPLAECQDKAARIAQEMTDATGECLCAVEGFDLVFGNLGKKRNYIPTGFSSLDRYVMFDRGDYMVIGGRPSAGKTAFSLQLVLNMSKQFTVAYFSLETKPSKIYERLMSCFTLSPFGEISRGKLSDPAKLFDARADFAKLKMHVVGAAGWTVAQIKAKAIQLRADVIMVDYIGLIKSAGKSLYERATNTSMDLHTLAQQSQIAVIALSQLNRQSTQKGNDDPDMADLRESGQIEQDADCVLLLKTPNSKQMQFNQERNLIIAKNKTGRTGKLNLNFEGEFQRFLETQER